MAFDIKDQFNKTQGEEINVPCSKCSGITYHKVLLSLDRLGEESDGFSDFYWDAHYQIIGCKGCKTISFRIATSNSEDFELIRHNEGQYVVYEELYPPRVEGRRGIGDEILYLPTQVQHIYQETLQALNAKSPILAGIGLRALVETVCKEKSATGYNLDKKIDDLVSKKILTPAGAEILHKIRTLGNNAAHEVKPHSDKKLGVAMAVVEHLLMDVYILPKQVDTELGSE